MATLPQPTALPTFHRTVDVDKLTDGQRTALTCGLHQVAFASWDEHPVGIVLVAADSYTRAEFGPGVFRVGDAQALQGSVVKFDPWAGTVQFVDSDAYRDHGVILWQPPFKLLRGIIRNLDAVLASYQAPSLINRLMAAARVWWDEKCPIKYVGNQHANNPTVNCTTAQESELAEAVAELVKE